MRVKPLQETCNPGNGLEGNTETRFSQSCEIYSTFPFTLDFNLAIPLNLTSHLCHDELQLLLILVVTKACLFSPVRCVCVQLGLACLEVH